MLIKELRVSFIQVDYCGEVLRALPPPAIPFDFLLSEGDFQKEFQKALTGKGAYRTPLGGDYGESFWSYYCKRDKDFWRVLVPLCYQPKLGVTNWPGNGLVNAYLYPWGVAALVDVSFSGEMDLDAAVQKAQGIRHGKTKVTVNGRDSSLPALIGAVLDEVRSTAFGSGVKRNRSQLFTVATVLDGEGVDPTQTVDGDTRKGLEGLTGWNTAWKFLPPQALDKYSIATKRVPPVGHVLYAADYGRAVWFPAYFPSLAADDVRLPPYHENLTMVSLQTLSLCEVAKDAATLVQQHVSTAVWSATYNSCAQLIAGVLGRLYGGDDSTYRSRSVCRQIDDTCKNSVNTLRRQYGMDELKLPGQTSGSVPDGAKSNATSNSKTTP